MTPQRVAVISSLLSRGDHPTAEQVYRDLKATYPMIALSTVYDALQLLVDMSEAVEVAPAATDRRFDPNTEDHCHLVCLRCDKIVDAPLAEPVPQPGLSALMKRSGFRPVRGLYQQFGYCADCGAESD